MLIKKYIIFIVLILIFVHISSNKAEILNVNNYEEKVINSKEAWLIEYYSERCGTCQEFSPIWESATNKIRKLRIGKVNIDEKSGMELATKNKILDEGIPLVKFIYGNRGENITIMAGDSVDEQVFLAIIKRYVLKFLGKTKSEGIYYNREDL
jgi:hypothetical protein